MRFGNPFRALQAFVRDDVVGRYAAIAVSAALVDLLTKLIAVRSLGETGLVPLFGRLSLLVVYNTGVTGGASIGPWTFPLNVLVTLLALGLVMWVVRPMAAVHGSAVTALGLVTGGAAGNLASMLLGPKGVADFIGVRLTADTTMVANVADLELWLGAGMLIPVALTLVRLARAERRNVVSISAAEIA
jgi:lipoprotein signal peptidase